MPTRPAFTRTALWRRGHPLLGIKPGWASHIFKSTKYLQIPLTSLSCATVTMGMSLGNFPLRCRQRLLSTSPYTTRLQGRQLSSEVTVLTLRGIFTGRYLKPSHARASSVTRGRETSNTITMRTESLGPGCNFTSKQLLWALQHSEALRSYFPLWLHYESQNISVATDDFRSVSPSKTWKSYLVHD